MAATDTTPVGRKGDKIIRDALLAVQRQQPDRLKRIAEKWWDAAETDHNARSSLADRLDGKATERVEVDHTSKGESIVPGVSRINDMLSKYSADEA